MRATLLSLNPLCAFSQASDPDENFSIKLDLLLEELQYLESCSQIQLELKGLLHSQIGTACSAQTLYTYNSAFISPDELDLQKIENHDGLIEFETGLKMRLAADFRSDEKPAILLPNMSLKGSCVVYQSSAISDSQTLQGVCAFQNVLMLRIMYEKEAYGDKNLAKVLEINNTIFDRYLLVQPHYSAGSKGDFLKTSLKHAIGVWKTVKSLLSGQSSHPHFNVQLDSCWASDGQESNAEGLPTYGSRGICLPVTIASERCLEKNPDCGVCQEASRYLSGAVVCKVTARWTLLRSFRVSPLNDSRSIPTIQASEETVFVNFPPALLKSCSTDAFAGEYEDMAGGKPQHYGCQGALNLKIPAMVITPSLENQTLSISYSLHLYFEFISATKLDSQTIKPIYCWFDVPITIKFPNTQTFIVQTGL